MLSHVHQSVIKHLWRKAGKGQAPNKKYVILDAARDEAVYPKLMVSDVDEICLYQRKQADALAEVAPYLVRLRREDSFLEWLLNNGWGKSWGIFIESSADINELKEHFQKFITVYDEDDESFFFRYYDPRVLRIYLPTCNEVELQIMFGPVKHYCVETEDGNSMIEYSCDYGQLTQRIIDLSQPKQSK